jgi:hypothetical protein
MVVLILSLEGYLPNLEGNVHIPHIHIFNFLFTKKSPFNIYNSSPFFEKRDKRGSSLKVPPYKAHQQVSVT